MDIQRLRDALLGPPWSRVMLTVARGVATQHVALFPKEGGGVRGKEVAVVRAPDMTGDDVIFAVEFSKVRTLPQFIIEKDCGADF